MEYKTSGLNKEIKNFIQQAANIGALVSTYLARQVNNRELERDKRKALEEAIINAQRLKDKINDLELDTKNKTIYLGVQDKNNMKG